MIRRIAKEAILKHLFAEVFAMGASMIFIG
jgi:hypothetical protein